MFLDSQYEIYEWNEVAGAWQIVSSAGSFASGKGYNIDQTTVSDGLLKFTGTVINSATFTATSPYVTGYTARSSLERIWLWKPKSDLVRYKKLDKLWRGRLEPAGQSVHFGNECSDIYYREHDAY